MKKPDETYQDYKKRALDPISPSFCAAKWYTAHIHLGSGRTKSCHHPPEHLIPVKEVQIDPSALHNTGHKKRQRKMMLEGKRPDECSYCWKMEDAGQISDRTFKTNLFTDEDVAQIPLTEWNQNLPLKRLEISFDRYCNFACSYCNPSFSTAWGRDIRKNGAYHGLVLPHSYDQDGSWAEPYGPTEENPYVEAFFKWWPELKNTLRELRITGGEPTMSLSFWDLLEHIKLDGIPDNLTIGVNTNLGMKHGVLARLVNATYSIKHFKLYTSCEAYQRQAEYLRDGLNYNDWLIKLSYFITNANCSMSHIMMCINALCLDSLPDFFRDMMEYKRTYGSSHPFLSVNMLQYPQFMSPLVLPKRIRRILAADIAWWFDQECDHSLLWPAEEESIQRMINIVRDGTPDFDVETAERDFYLFYKQYDNRRDKSLVDTFPGLIADWYQGLEKKYGEMVETNSCVVAPPTKPEESPTAD
jgi:hypothetical protein